MKKALKYRSELQRTICSLEARCTRLGDVYFFVTYTTNENKEAYASFKHLSSAIDFIETNLQ